jgi:hypothetical protein
MSTIEAAVPEVRVPALVLPAELSVEEYRLETPPEAEASLYFTHGDPRLLHASARGQTFPAPYCTQDALSMCASLGGKQLVAKEVYSNDGSSGNVILKQDGREIYRIGIGPGSPVSALQGLWVYDGHWALEAAKITETHQGNSTMVDAVG